MRRYLLLTFFCPFSPNTSSSSSSPTERSSWPLDINSEDPNPQSYMKKMKRSRSFLSKSKRRKSPGTPRAGFQMVHEFSNLTSDHIKAPCCYDDPKSDSLEAHSCGHTDEKASCSCTDSEHDVPLFKRPSEECPCTVGSPVCVPGRKAKRRKRWNSNSDSSSASKHISLHENSSDEISDLEPQFIPNLTNESLRYTDDERFKNTLQQDSEPYLDERSEF